LLQPEPIGSAEIHPDGSLPGLASLFLPAEPPQGFTPSDAQCSPTRRKRRGSAYSRSASATRPACINASAMPKRGSAQRGPRSMADRNIAAAAFGCSLASNAVPALS
jgi:hypothetical protein